LYCRRTSKLDKSSQTVQKTAEKLQKVHIKITIQKKAVRCRRCTFFKHEKQQTNISALDSVDLNFQVYSEKEGMLKIPIK